MISSGFLGNLGVYLIHPSKLCASLRDGGHSARRDTGSTTFSTMLAHATAFIGGLQVTAIASVTHDE